MWIGGRHEALEVVFRHDRRLDHHPLDRPAHIVERHEVVGIRHGEGEPVVGEGDGDDAVGVDESLGQERHDARIDLDLGQVDEVHAGVAVGLDQAAGQHAHHCGGERRMRGEHLFEVSLLEHGARGGLERQNGGDARLAGEQGHLAEHLSRAELGEHEVHAAVRIPAPDRHPARQDEERRTVAAALADDQRLGHEVAAPHAAFELQAGVSRQGPEERHLVEEGRGVWIHGPGGSYRQSPRKHGSTEKVGSIHDLSTRCSPTASPRFLLQIIGEARERVEPDHP